MPIIGFDFEVFLVRVKQSKKTFVSSWVFLSSSCKSFFGSQESINKSLQERKVLLYDDDRLLNGGLKEEEEVELSPVVVKTKKESVEHFSLIIVKRCRNYWVALNCCCSLVNFNEGHHGCCGKCAKTCHPKSCKSETGTNFWQKRGILILYTLF